MPPISPHGRNKGTTQWRPKRVGLQLVLIHNLFPLLINPSVSKHTSSQLISFIKRSFIFNYWLIMFSIQCIVRFAYIS